MRLVELRYHQQRPFVLDLHPRLTVITGLGEEGRPWLRELLGGIMRGNLEGLTGEIEVRGARRELSAATISSLGLPEGIDITVQAAALPGVQLVLASSPPPPDSTELIDIQATTDPTTRAETEDGVESDTEGGAVSTEAEGDPEAKAQTEVQGQGLEEALDPAPAEAAIRAAAAELANAVQRTQAAVRRLKATEAAELARLEAAEAAQLIRADRQAHIERRRQEVTAALAEAHVVDPAPVKAALAELRRIRSTEPGSSAEGTALADALVDVWTRIQTVPAPSPSTPSVEQVKEARHVLQAAQAELTKAEGAARRPIELDPEGIAALERAHCSVVRAEEKVGWPLIGLLARRQVEMAERAEAAILKRLGFPSFGVYLLQTSQTVITSGSDLRLVQARATLADAEAAWHEVQAEVDREAERQALHDSLQDEEARLREQAVRLLGHDPGEELEDALRHTREELDLTPAAQALTDALAGAGASLPDPANLTDVAALDAAAEAWLESAQQARAHLADLQAELNAIMTDLQDLTHQATKTSMLTEEATRAFQAKLDTARSAHADALTAEQAAREALVAAQARARVLAQARARAAGTDPANSDDSVAEPQEPSGAGLTASVAQAVDVSTEARVQRLKDTERPYGNGIAQAEATATRLTQPVRLDVSQVELSELEVYLLSRVAAQRDVGNAGSLPLVLDDALAGLDSSIVASILGDIERLSSILQVIYLTDDPEIETWVHQFSAENAIVRRFSRVAAKTA